MESQCAAILKYIGYGLYQEYAMVHSKIMFYLLQDALHSKSSKHQAADLEKDLERLPGAGGLSKSKKALSHLWPNLPGC